jgi:hypothetical protein
VLNINTLPSLIPSVWSFDSILASAAIFQPARIRRLRNQSDRPTLWHTICVPMPGHTKARGWTLSLSCSLTDQTKDPTRSLPGVLAVTWMDVRILSGVF